MARSWRSSVTEGNGLQIGWLGLGDLVSLKDGFGWERDLSTLGAAQVFWNRTCIKTRQGTSSLVKTHFQTTVLYEQVCQLDRH